MLDRSQRFGIAVSCGLHVLVAGAFTLVSALAPSRADSSLPPEAVIVQIRLDGPETRVIDAAPHRSGAAASRPSASAMPLPAVSAPPPKVASDPAAAKPAAAKRAEPKSAPAPLPAPRTEPDPPLESEPEPEPERHPESARESDARSAAPAASQVDGPAPEGEATASASGDGSALASADAMAGASNASGLPGRATGGGDEEDDPYARYIESVRTAVQARKHYPPLARKRSVEGRVVARLAIRADGRIQTIEFEQGAQPLLRRATQDAIRAAEPYPAPPEGAVTIELPIDYSLRDAS